jgi:hypothetical protein
MWWNRALPRFRWCNNAQSSHENLDEMYLFSFPYLGERVGLDILYGTPQSTGRCGWYFNEANARPTSLDGICG